MNPDNELDEAQDEGEDDGEASLTRAVFAASFPPIQGAIKRDGAGNGMRIQLDIPESEMSRAIWLQTMTNCELRVTIEKVSNPHEPQSGTSGRTRPRRRVVQSDSGV